MSDFAREAIPILVMFGFVLMLAPFIAVALWMAFDGDRARPAPAVRTADAPAVVDQPQRIKMRSAG